MALLLVGLLLSLDIKAEAQFDAFASLSNAVYLHWTLVWRHNVHFWIYEMFIVAGCASVPCTSFSNAFIFMKLCIEWEAGGALQTCSLKCLFFSKKVLLRQDCLCGSLVIQGKNRAPFHFVICMFYLSFIYRSVYKRKFKNKVFATISNRSNWTEGACSCCFCFHGSW